MRKVHVVLEAPQEETLILARPEESQEIIQNYIGTNSTRNSSISS